MSPRVISPSPSGQTSACQSSSSLDLPDSLPSQMHLSTPSTPSLPTSVQPTPSSLSPSPSSKRSLEYDSLHQQDISIDSITPTSFLPIDYDQPSILLPKRRRINDIFTPTTTSWSSCTINSTSITNNNNHNHNMTNNHTRRKIELPDEVLVAVFSFVRRASSLAQLRAVCKQWCTVIDTTPAVWRRVSFRNAIFGRCVETNCDRLILGKRAGARAVTLAARAGNEWACFLHSVLFQSRALCAVTTPQPVASMLVRGERAVHERAFPPWQDREQPKKGGTWVAIHAARRIGLEDEVEIGAHEIQHHQPDGGGGGGTMVNLNENIIQATENQHHYQEESYYDSTTGGEQNEANIDHREIEAVALSVANNASVAVSNNLNNSVSDAMNAMTGIYGSHTISNDVDPGVLSEVSSGGFMTANSNFSPPEPDTDTIIDDEPITTANDSAHGAMVGVIHVKEAFEMAGSGVGLSASHWVWRIDRAVSLKKPIRCAGYLGLWPLSTYMSELLVNSLHRQ